MEVEKKKLIKPQASNAYANMQQWVDSHTEAPQHPEF